jgi:hypothetical protein
MNTAAITASAYANVVSRIDSPFTNAAGTTVTNGCSSINCPTRATPVIAVAALKTKNARYWLTRPRRRTPPSGR